MPGKIMGRKYLFENIRKSILDVNASNGRVHDEVDSLLATLVDESERQTNRAATDAPASHWGIGPEHPLFAQLGQFEECPELLPVPENATLDILTEMPLSIITTSTIWNLSGGSSYTS